MASPRLSLASLMFTTVLLLGCNPGTPTQAPTPSPTPTANPSPPTPPTRTDPRATPVDPTPSKPMEPVTNPAETFKVLKEAGTFPAGTKTFVGLQLALSFDGKTVIVGSSGAVRLLDTSNGKEIAWKDPKTAEKMKASTGGFCFSSDGKQLWVAGPQEILNVDPVTHQIQGKITTGRDPYGRLLTLSADGKYLATNHFVYDVKANKELFPLSQDNGDSTTDAITFSHDGKILVETTSREQLNLWEVENKKVKKTIPFPPPLKEGHLKNPLASPTADVFSIVSDKKVQIRDVVTGDVQRTFGTKEEFQGNPMRWSPDGKTLAIPRGISIEQEGIWLVDVATGKPFALLGYKSGTVEAITYSGDGTKVAAVVSTGYGDNTTYTTHVWDLAQLLK
jgi:WD40 repeat protein